MSDSEFDFQRPPERREVKPFEPPPWERGAFEELQRRKAEEEVARAAAVLEPGPQQAESVPEAAPLGTHNDERVRVVDEEPAHEVEQRSDEVTENPVLDERVVLEMMAQLAEQEPKLHEKTWKIAVVSAMVVGALGLVMTVWGVAAVFKARTAGMTAIAGALVLLAFGAGFVALAAWMIVRTLRQRGVL